MARSRSSLQSEFCLVSILFLGLGGSGMISTGMLSGSLPELVIKSGFVEVLALVSPHKKTSPFVARDAVRSFSNSQGLFCCRFLYLELPGLM